MRRMIELCCIVLWFEGLIFIPAATATYHSTSQRGLGVKIPNPSFSVSWLDDKTTYQAGDSATIKIKLLNNSLIGNLSTYNMQFSVSVGGKKGNSSYISAVFAYIGGDPTFWNISLTPIQVGNFSVVVVEDFSGVADSSLHFSVTAGPMYPSACLPSWIDFFDESLAGTKTYLLIYPKDAFGNNVSLVHMRTEDYFTLSTSYSNGTAVEIFNLVSIIWNELGYLVIEFTPTIAGRFLLHVYGDNQTLNGSPLPFSVTPGPLNITSSIAKWKYDINSLQIFSKLQIFVHQNDRFGNLVPGFYPFDAQVVQKATGLSVPVGDLSFQEVDYGIQLVSFAVSEPGDFMITIFNSKLNESIYSLPYTVFVGNCHGLNSFANGSGLISSVAGRLSWFTVYLEDAYTNPSPVEAEQLYVEIRSRNFNIMIRPIIHPLKSFNGTYRGPVSTPSDILMGTSGFVHLTTSKGNRTFIGKYTVQASEFGITYIPEKSGDYEIRLSCGNIPLNDAISYSMKVLPGLVDTVKSKVVNSESEVRSIGKIEILVELVDSFWNYVPSQEANLKLQLQGPNNTSLLKTTFIESKDGLYIGYYLPTSPGSFNICVSFEEKILSPCPVKFHVHESKYFPEANNDSVSVWEDESVVFDVLFNDYASDGQASLSEFSKPLHGSLLLVGKLFRYTPFKGYFGNDSFLYNITDSNNNVAIGAAFISVLCKPPQFVSLPLRLNVTEDVLSPQFGGFPGFEIRYSDKMENISLTISAKFGSVYLAPSQIGIFEPVGGMLSVRRGGRAGKDLVLTGPIEVVNSALQLIQYLSNENFYGDDTISLYATNRNGLLDSHVPVFVKPINDPPKIHVPKFITLVGKEASDGFQIFDKQRDIFEFSISDSDIFHYTGNKSHLVVMFSVEVNDGLLSTTLPVHLIKTSELKIKSSNQWQPLQTFVTIDNQFVIKGRGVRFQGTIRDCNNAMQRLFFQGTNLDALLTITVNDLGNYGCYLDCTDIISFPLSVEVSVSLLKRRPLTSTTAFLLGSAIFFEIATLFLLGSLLLFFIFKCMVALHTERNNGDNPREELTENHNEKIDILPFQNAMNLNRTSTRSLSTPLNFSRSSKFRRR
ncbi:protein GAMETE EXPRESSED 2-like isoform X2 [Phalaenopsis equestris]|nr:protein GAMETE EXPRESSED 2-like isoform X2 [Phalaenopsis equestris]